MRKMRPTCCFHTGVRALARTSMTSEHGGMINESDIGCSILRPLARGVRRGAIELLKIRAGDRRWGPAAMRQGAAVKPVATHQLSLRIVPIHMWSAVPD